MENNDILNKVIVNANNENVISDSEKNSIAVQSENRTKVHNADAISEENINDFFSSDFVKLIVLAGLPSYGKTTLISCIYDKFIQDGEYGGYEFAGSKTILGFEKRSYLSRLKNGQRADTRRTVLNEDNPYLDLSLINSESNEKQRVMLFDTSGEVFGGFLVDNQSILDFKSLRRANHFSYIFDISIYNNPRDRHLALDRAKTIFRLLKDQKMFPPNLSIELVFTKWDKITENDNITAYKNSLINEVKLLFPSLKICDFNVSCISDEKPFQLLDLFKYWLNSPCIHEYSNFLDYKTINWGKDYLNYLDHD